MARFADLVPIKLLLPAIPMVTLAIGAVKFAAPPPGDPRAKEQAAEPAKPVVKPTKPQPPPPPPRPIDCDARCAPKPSK